MSYAVDFLLAGVGGQGILTASDIVAEVGLEAGWDAKKSEVHGFSQRGGVVESHVRWGESVAAPTAEPGSVDILVATELLEAARWAAWLRPGGIVLVSNHRILPMSVTVSNATYPPEEAIIAALRAQTDDVTVVPALAMAQRLGSARLANTVLLGVLSARLDVSEQIWLDVLDRRVPARLAALNREAFRAGRQWWSGSA